MNYTVFTKTESAPECPNGLVELLGEITRLLLGPAFTGPKLVHALLRPLLLRSVQSVERRRSQRKPAGPGIRMSWLSVVARLVKLVVAVVLRVLLVVTAAGCYCASYGYSQYDSYAYSPLLGSLEAQKHGPSH